MGRLTVQDDQGNWSVNGLAWKSLYVGTPITQEVYEILYGCLCKLKDYEDTGLSPDEVEEMDIESHQPVPLEDKSILLVQGEDGVWGVKKEPFAVVEYDTEETFTRMKEILARNQAKSVDNLWHHVDHRSGTCPVCGKRLISYGDELGFCYGCGQKLDWGE